MLARMLPICFMAIRVAGAQLTTYPALFPDEVGAETASLRDAEVISAAIHDLAGHEPIGVIDKASRKPVLLLDSVTSKWQDPYFTVRQLSNDVRWAKWNLPDPLLRNIDKRNATAVSLKEVELGKNIVLKDIAAQRRETKASKASPSYNKYVSARLPGYSRNGKEAVVNLGFAVPSHNGSATYLLKLVDGEWVVQKRALTHYCTLPF